MKGKEMEQECDEYSEGSLSKLICLKTKFGSFQFRTHSLKKPSCLSILLATLFAKYITSILDVYFLFFLNYVDG